MSAQYPKRPLELYARAAEESLLPAEWQAIIAQERCPYLGRRCAKTRKSDPSITIGTCTVGSAGHPVVICPYRLLEERTVFRDALPLLSAHGPGNSIHVVPEVGIPGGNIDYFVVSVKDDVVVDYVALEIQTLDTTGTVWPARQRFIRDVLQQPEDLARDDRSYNINWKMSAKTILVQIHHKARTLELLHKKLILVIQDVFYDYMVQAFATTSLLPARSADPVHLHAYHVSQHADGRFGINLVRQESTSTAGVEQMLGLARGTEIAEQV